MKTHLSESLQTHRQPAATASGRLTLQAARQPFTPRESAQRRMLEACFGSALQRQPEASPGLTGMPNVLKAGIESLSGVDLSDVRVHRNSSRPAELQAHAYAQGRDIHLAPGQEQHLPHEAWHVVQQAQGRVRPTMQMAGISVNDDGELEREADEMGEQALRGAPLRQPNEAAGPAQGSQVLQGAFWEKVDDTYVWHGGHVKPDDSYSLTEETRRGKTKSTKKNDYGVYTKIAVPEVEAEDAAEDVASNEEAVEEEPTAAYSFEAAGDGSHAVSVISSMASTMTEDDYYDFQVGFYEAEDNLMPSATANIERLEALAESDAVRGRLRVRVNYGRDATEENSPTRYDGVNVRNIMAGYADGSSNTSYEANKPLAEGVFAAQSEKLKSGGRLHFAASGRPYFKPGDHRDHFPDRVKVDDMATGVGLNREPDEEFTDEIGVMKNQGARSVGVNGTYTRVYSKD